MSAEQAPITTTDPMRHFEIPSTLNLDALFDSRLPEATDTNPLDGKTTFSYRFPGSIDTVGSYNIFKEGSNTPYFMVTNIPANGVNDSPSTEVVALDGPYKGKMAKIMWGSNHLEDTYTTTYNQPTESALVDFLSSQLSQPRQRNIPISVATMEVHPHAFVCIDFNTALATRTRDTYGIFEYRRNDPPLHTADIYPPMFDGRDTSGKLEVKNMFVDKSGVPPVIMGCLMAMIILINPNRGFNGLRV